MRKGIKLLLSLLLITIFVGCIESSDIIPGPKPKDKENQDELKTDNKEIKTLLTDKFKNVEELGVLYPYASSGDYIEVRYNIAKDKEKIEEIYKSIKGTRDKYHKVSPQGEGQQSDPTFIINIYYNGGKMDEIASTESGEYIFRNTTTKNPSWVGGSNSQLEKLLGDGSELYSLEYRKIGENIKVKLTSFQSNMKSENKEEITNFITSNITEDAYENLKEGNLEITGPIIYYQNGDVSIDAINRKLSRNESTNEFMTFTFVNIEGDMKINNIECITDTFIYSN
ncbi:hypothetical protein ACPWSR_05870 [Alloiococcus sp. CFN-8]|uniref:hypothetical protein n=1 Tax=Alloiococcus sp. CFN-8 TaxID=3416081 RepID=UPI003CF790C8